MEQKILVVLTALANQLDVAATNTKQRIWDARAAHSEEELEHQLDTILENANSIKRLVEQIRDEIEQASNV